MRSFRKKSPQKGFSMRPEKLFSFQWAKKGFISLKKAVDFNQKPSADGGIEFRSAQIVRERISLTGFTLIEIMIVVAIIVVIAAIAIPAVLRSRVTANEASAITSLKTINWATITYKATNAVYPSNLTDLSTCDPSYIDSVLASGTKQGYNFSLVSTNSTFSVTAVPTVPNITGVRTFYTDTGGVVRASGNGTVADETSTPI